MWCHVHVCICECVSVCVFVHVFVPRSCQGLISSGWRERRLVTIIHIDINELQWKELRGGNTQIDRKKALIYVTCSHSQLAAPEFLK